MIWAAKLRTMMYSGDGLNSLVTVRVQPGTYMIAVTRLSVSSGFIRMVVERNVPSQPYGFKLNSNTIQAEKYLTSPHHAEARALPPVQDHWTMR